MLILDLIQKAETDPNTQGGGGGGGGIISIGSNADGFLFISGETLDFVNPPNTANGFAALDGSANLLYPTTPNPLADASGNLYYGDGASVLADTGPTLYLPDASSVTGGNGNSGTLLFDNGDISNVTGSPSLDGTNIDLSNNTSDISNVTGSPSLDGTNIDLSNNTSDISNVTGSPSLDGTNIDLSNNTSDISNVTGSPSLDGTNIDLSNNTSDISNVTGNPALDASNMTGNPALDASNMTGNPALDASNMTNVLPTTRFTYVGGSSTISFNSSGIDETLYDNGSTRSITINPMPSGTRAGQIFRFLSLNGSTTVTWSGGIVNRPDIGSMPTAFAPGDSIAWMFNGTGGFDLLYKVNVTP